MSKSCTFSSAAMSFPVSLAPFCLGRSTQSFVLCVMAPQLESDKGAHGKSERMISGCVDGKHLPCRSSEAAFADGWRRRAPLYAGAESDTTLWARNAGGNPTHFSQAPLRYLVAWKVFAPRSYQFPDAVSPAFQFF